MVITNLAATLKLTYLPYSIGHLYLNVIKCVQLKLWYILRVLYYDHYRSPKRPTQLVLELAPVSTTAKPNVHLFKIVNVIDELIFPNTITDQTS